MYVGDLFVNAELVERGYAEAARYPPDVAHADFFENLHAQAAATNIGCWSTGAFDGGGGEAEQPTQPIITGEYVCANNEACVQGNINSEGVKIYHYPGCQSYNQTKINEANGERFFTTGAEASAAGWRVAMNC